VTEIQKRFGDFGFGSFDIVWNLDIGAWSSYVQNSSQSKAT
jgi:hypothetical protein